MVQANIRDFHIYYFTNRYIYILIFVAFELGQSDIIYM